jgi:cyanophycinase
VLPIQLRNRFIELAGGTESHVVVITTASVYADTDKMEAKLSFWREQKVASLTVLHTRSRRTADEAEFARPLREATGVWFVGGNQNWLTETYLGTVTEREIRGVLTRSGVVGGTSAGAAIMSPVMIRRDKPEVETGPGFGFLPGTVVDQHFLKRNRQGRLLKVLGSYPDLVGLGIDEGTGLVVEGNRLSVVGDSQVVVCSPATGDSPESVQSLEPGSETDLGQLRALMAQLVVKPVAAVVSASVTQPADPAEPQAAQPVATVSDDPEAVSKVGQ